MGPWDLYKQKANKIKHLSGDQIGSQRKKLCPSGPRYFFDKSSGDQNESPLGTKINSFFFKEKPH